jgi:predicted transcriptional regulator
MTTITLTIPDDLAVTLAAMPEHERNHFAVAALQTAIEEMPETQEELAALVGPLTPEDIASLGRGFADADAGRYVDPETVFANLRKRVGLPAR